MTKDDLLKFCHQCLIRPFLSTPHNDGVNTYCSNGKLAIRIPRIIEGTAGPVLPGESPIPAVFQKYAAEGDKYEYVALPEIPPAEHCPDCEGTGTQYDCKACNGTGTLPGDDDEDCPRCDGSGRAANKADGKVASCWHCDGSGNKEHQPVQMPNGQYIARRYLELLTTLPGIAVSTMPPPSDDPYQYHPLRFTFSENGEAFCMPLIYPRLRP